MRFCHLCRAARFCGSTIIVLYKILEINRCRCRDDVHIVSTVPMLAYKFRCMKKGGHRVEITGCPPWHIAADAFFFTYSFRRSSGLPGRLHTMRGRWRGMLPHWPRPRVCRRGARGFVQPIACVFRPKGRWSCR